MFNSVILRNCTIGFISLVSATISHAEKVGVFYDSTIEQIKFAASDVKAALEEKKFTVEMLPLTSLDASYAEAKVVIALDSDSAVKTQLTKQGASAPTGLTEQAYALRTTESPKKSYWALGNDANGAMYGGLQIAENIKFHSLSGTYNTQESPTILKRGIKLNLPWDKASATYGRFDKGSYDGTSAQLAIADVWDMTFWTTWFDEMARNRYNIVSLWSCNPFSSLVSVPGYEDCSIENVTLFDGTVKPMTITQKIQFWQNVMSHAHARGFEFLIFNWNVFTYGATGKHGIVDGKQGATDPETIDYMYKAMTSLLETYPNLDGFGLSTGENGGTEEFVWNAYGKAMFEYAKANPKRNLKFIHRLHFGDFSSMTEFFAPLHTVKNVSFDISVKHSQAHMYSTAVPKWWPDEYQKIQENDLKTWLTVRNDSFYYHTWGDPAFARAYVDGMLSLGPIFKGFYMGSDGFNPTRTFFYKNKAMNGQLEVLRQQYQMMIWGRISYNPKTPDEIFINYLHDQYPAVDAKDLFKAWSKASRGVQQTTELICRGHQLDFKWWPEGCQRDTRMGRIKKPVFITIQDFSDTNVTPGSLFASISNSADGKLSGKKSSYVLADEIEKESLSALSLVESMKAEPNTPLAVALHNIKSMAYLGLYYSCKIRGATFLKATRNEEAKNTMGSAYSWWMKYTNLNDAMYQGMEMQRTESWINWHVHDESVLKEYTDLGGVGIPPAAKKEAR